MENIVDMPPSVITRLSEAASHADATGARMRILTGVNVDGRKWVKWDCGRGWTEPYYSLDTPYVSPLVEAANEAIALNEPIEVTHRDEPDTDDGLVCDDCGGTDGRHFLHCRVWPFNS